MTSWICRSELCHLKVREYNKNQVNFTVEKKKYQEENVVRLVIFVVVVIVVAMFSLEEKRKREKKNKTNLTPCFSSCRT